MYSQLGRLKWRMEIARKLLNGKYLVLGEYESDREFETDAREVVKNAQNRRLAAILVAYEAAPLEQKKV